MRPYIQKVASRTLVCLLFVIVVISPFPTAPAFADSYFFDDIDKSLLSIGGRGTYFDPNDTSPKWYGGAQVRLHLGQVFAIEGSVDYREKKFDSTFTRTFPSASTSSTACHPTHRADARRFSLVMRQ